MKKDRVPYQKQIFVCTNNRNGESPSCGDHHGEEIFKQLRQRAKDRGYHPEIRVAQAKCLGKCAMGTNVMIYPDNVWYSEVKLREVDELADLYLPVRK